MVASEFPEKEKVTATLMGRLEHAEHGSLYIQQNCLFSIQLVGVIGPSGEEHSTWRRF
jgi:hypothetical protein